MIDADRDLLDRLLLGDVRALEELVERYQIPVYRLAYRMTGNRADAEDIAQEAFVRAFRSLPGFRRASSLKTWLFRIAINLALDHRRRHDAAGQPTLEWADAPASTDPVEEREHQEALHEAIAGLPPVQRATVTLRIVHDLSLKEIGEIMGAPIGTVKANYHHAVSRLRLLVRERFVRT